MAGKKRFNSYKISDDTGIIFVKYKDSILETKIDRDDLDKVISLGSWHAIKDESLHVPSYYIAHRFSDGGVIKLHRLITDCPRNMVVDHINHDTLDNRKRNLKVCTIFENQQNQRSCKTGVPGVYQRKNGKWVANITKNNKRLYKETHSFEEAVEERKRMLKAFNKEVI